jgi:hypothetical protein
VDSLIVVVPIGKPSEAVNDVVVVVGEVKDCPRYILPGLVVSVIVLCWVNLC